MEILSYDPEYAIIICRICKHALLPGSSAITTHLSSYHKDMFEARKIRASVATLSNCHQDPVEIVQLKRIPDTAPPHALLTVFDDGLACRLCDRDPKILRTREGITLHLKDQHKWNGGRKRGRISKSEQRQQSSSLESVTRRVSCQTFFAGHHRRYFEVRTSSGNSMDETMAAEEPTLRKEVEEDLSRKLERARKNQSSVVTTAHRVDVSPWLEMTRWPQYLQGKSLLSLAPLVDMPPRTDTADIESHDIVLQQLSSSFDRIIELARDSILTEKVNVFDQHRINSFIHRRSSERQLFYKLQEETYKQYKAVWQRLLCYVYRVVVQRLQPDLTYVMTSLQSICCVVSIECPVHELDAISIDWTSNSHFKIMD